MWDGWEGGILPPAPPFHAVRYGVCREFKVNALDGILAVRFGMYVVMVLMHHTVRWMTKAVSGVVASV